MFASLQPPISSYAEQVGHSSEVTSHEHQSLLVDFLSHALCLSDTYGKAYNDATIEQLTKTHIKWTLHGTKVDAFGEGKIKSVTHHDLKLEQKNGHRIADVLFDIKKRKNGHGTTHRKRATRAFGPGRSELPAVYKDIGNPELIPETMGTASYVLVKTKEGRV